MSQLFRKRNRIKHMITIFCIVNLLCFIDITTFASESNVVMEEYEQNSTTFEETDVIEEIESQKSTYEVSEIKDDILSVEVSTEEVSASMDNSMGKEIFKNVEYGTEEEIFESVESDVEEENSESVESDVKEENSESVKTSTEEENVESSIMEDEPELGESIEDVVLEIDLGEYESQMYVGNKQLLHITIIPIDAEQNNITYETSNSDIATINGLGRITANKVGKCEITVSCGEAKASFLLTVKNKESNNILIEDIDVGDCPTKIIQGTSQIIYPLTIPANATVQSFTYSSNNNNVVSINALGRITGVSVGTATITVYGGNKSKSFSVEVVENEELKKVAVTDIEIASHSESLYVKSTMSIAATILPDNATNAKLTYASSNKNIATVSSNGEVKGISVGDVIIYVSAGGVTKEIPLKIKVSTDVIKLNENYIVLKPENTFQIQANVEPAEAPKTLTYKSLNTNIATVSDTGLVSAIGNGNTAIVISNGDMQVSIVVFVNDNTTIESEEGVCASDSIDEKKKFSDVLTTEENELISKEMLIYYYKNNSLVTVEDDKYIIYLEGKNIVNFENALETNICLRETKSGYEFIINNYNNLCGKFVLALKEDYGKYLYLYNEQKRKYERIDTPSCKNIMIDTAGKYLITENIVKDNRVKAYYGIFIISSIGVLLLVHLIYRKRYLFW